MEKILIHNFTSYRETVGTILKESGLAGHIKNQKLILIKPNLTTNLPPPTTTPAGLVEEVVRFCKTQSSAKIIIAEGSGGCDTEDAFVNLGYTSISKKYGVELVDLNRSERIEKQDSQALQLKKVILPKIAFESYIINVAVLKVHSAAGMTAAMKNVFGFYLNKALLEQRGLSWMPAQSLARGWWNKSELHALGVDEAITDLNTYIKCDFNIVDASVGQLGSEVQGYPCDPPIGKIVAGYDPRIVDRSCVPLLGLTSEEIDYISNSRE